MAIFNDDADRRVIPRLRTFEMTRLLGQLDSLVDPVQHEGRAEELLASKVAAWREFRTFGHASDLVGAALTFGFTNDSVRAAAKLLRHGGDKVSAWARELGQSAIALERNDAMASTVRLERRVDDPTLYAQVKTFRSLLRQEPRDPVTWVDLAFSHACLGQRKRAARSMAVAVQLARNNRFVLRSAGRLWIYLDDPERAYQIVAKSDRTIHDPWLLAAEIALGSIASKRPKHVKEARRLLSSDQFGPRHISELASALATVELNSGSLKRARRLFARSLQEPTENSIAQAAWAGRQSRELRLARDYPSGPNAFEAQSWHCYQKEEWRGVIRNSRRWFADQPFSSRPAALGSYVAATALGDYSASKWFARTGLRANPTSVLLLNNLAFSCLMTGDVDEGAQALGRIHRSTLSQNEAIAHTATQGLLALCRGDRRRGRALYADARERAKRMREEDGGRMYALTSLFYALAEAAVSGDEGDAVCREALSVAAKTSDPIVRTLIGRLSEERLSP